MKKWQVKAMEKKEAEGHGNKKDRVIQKMAFIFIIVVVSFSVLMLLNRNKLKSNPEPKSNSSAVVNNVSIVDGKQIIELTAKAGYSPKRSVAKAGIPTILKVDTNGTFDCSSAIRIPSLKLSKNLPTTGETNIDLGQPQAGLFTGTCAMGMYPFEIEFKS